MSILDKYKNKLINDNCLNTLQVLPENSIDSIITDPPYGISFMGKHWDKALPDLSIWKECLRVLKAGAFMFVMCIPRSDCQARMILLLEEAGFNVKFSPIYWTYASGFPKAANISKMIDKKEGAIRDRVDIGDGHKSTSINKSGYGVEGWSKQIDIPITDNAKQFDGSYGGCQLKPAVEVILVVMKPLQEKTFVDQALNNGHGVTWLDDCRIPFVSEEDKDSCSFRNNTIDKSSYETLTLPSKPLSGNTSGRFPAHLLCSDDVLNDEETYKSGGDTLNVKRHGFKGWKQTEEIVNGKGTMPSSGSFSRYFDLDLWFDKRFDDLPERIKRTFPFIIQPKPDKTEKNKGCEELSGHYHQAKSRTFDDKCATCGKKLVGDLPYRCTCPEGEKQTEKRITKGNFHPTCKPIKLMSWLITLSTRKHDIVLDPFSGSGTVAIASKLLDRDYIGIEIDKEYNNIAESRIKAWDTQLTLFE